MNTKIKITLKKIQRPTIFFLDWPENSAPCAKWITYKPDDVSFEANINWRGIGKIIVCCCGQQRESLTQIPKETIYHNVSLLKSLLQKYVRRQMSEKAVQTAWHLIKLDADAFLRRIFVIMLEDVTLHSSISVIVWLTSAVSKGYTLHSNHINWLLGFTQYLCEEKHKSYLDFIDYEQYDVPSILSQTNQSNLSAIEKDVTYSILLRLSYGGMKSDLNMFYWYAIQLSNKEVPISMEIFSSINGETIQPLKICNTLSNGADFHCFPQIIRMIHQQFPKMTESVIKHAIWECNSKTNTRIPNIIDSHLRDIWKEIKPLTRQLQKQLIHYNH